MSRRTMKKMIHRQNVCNKHSNNGGCSKNNHNEWSCGNNSNCTDNTNFDCTLVSVRNPTTPLPIPMAEEMSGDMMSFFQSQVQVNAYQSQVQQVDPNSWVHLTGWTDNIVDIANLFNNETGIYTVPQSGDYRIILNVNYETTVPLHPDFSLTNVPLVEVYNLSTGQTHITGSALPTINTIITVPPISSEDPPIDVPITSVLNKASFMVESVVSLIAGQQIGVRASANGMVSQEQIVVPPMSPQIIFNPTGADTVLTIQKIRNTPTVTVSINNNF